MKKLPATKSSSCCETIDQKREPISFPELRKLMKWTYSDRGELLADAWDRLNQTCFRGVLKPVPILLPSSPPYGHWVGLCTGNLQGETIHIQLKRDMPMKEHYDVLLHECLHAYLRECGESTDHNDVPWCREIMRLSTELWGVGIWASPSQPRKVKGVSKRVQKPRADGAESVKRTAISRWPQSMSLNLVNAPGWTELLATIGSTE